MVYLAEFVGTAILTLLGCGVVAGVTLARSKAEGSGWIVITFGWGLAVTVAVYVVGQYSGAHINPAVTFAMASIGELGWAQVPGYIAAQLLGAFFGAVLAWVVYLPHWRVTEDPVVKLGVFSTIPAVRSIAANFATEVIGTFLLIFGILGINANMNPIGAGGGGLQDLFGTGFAPLLVGFLVLAIGLSLGGPTGYAINPARDLGPRIAHAVLPIPGKGSSDWSYSWVPIVAPIVGAVLAAQVYVLLGFEV
ncbi:MIP/aquaporin family protein [Streptomonospora nanhaiensis]|uniref:Glycerol uptake facilitator protein n=1 Tax=Streptomonospora nanhaiensis TaxID=1323731 RepID=A0A853BJ67_9ACTN|nr:MIP/aquaporin family protein [Streptomonospora nanhaiensis]MBV2365601.1 aquaporin family protein [Streptomonospora nanhaiensis]MBX9389582.1 aquaporin family protein [Streptomonospora nanhaiensis]NYI95499.1 glycerol uptake facilitator protein [Streptomonospora nanhaiensis]